MCKERSNDPTTAPSPSNVTRDQFNGCFMLPWPPMALVAFYVSPPFMPCPRILPWIGFCEDAFGLKGAVWDTSLGENLRPCDSISLRLQYLGWIYSSYSAFSLILTHVSSTNTWLKLFLVMSTGAKSMKTEDVTANLIEEQTNFVSALWEGLSSQSASSSMHLKRSFTPFRCKFSSLSLFDGQLAPSVFTFHSQILRMRFCSMQFCK